MPKKRTADDLLPKEAVYAVREETPLERITRLLLGDINRVSALIVILFGMTGSTVIMLVSNSLRMPAFQLFSAIVTGALGFFFATRSGR
jgi:hypothetical protein